MPAAIPAALSIRGLTVTVAGRMALEDVSLSAPAGAITAILGEAGAGKTTLLAAVAGLLKPVRGAVLVGGTDVTGVRPARRGIGFLTPGTSLRQDATLRTALEHVAGRGHRAGAQAALQGMALESLAHMRLGEATHGQAFAALAAARMLPQGAVLLVDEAGTGLSEPLRQQLWRALRAEACAGRTVVVATRDWSVAMAADHLVLLGQRRVLQAGAPATIFAEPRCEAAALLTGPANILRGTLRQKVPGGFVWVAAGQRFTQQEVPGLLPPILGGEVVLCLRPDDLDVGDAWPNRLQGTVGRLVSEGSRAAVHCDCALGAVQATGRMAHSLRPGMTVTLSWAPASAVVLPPAA